MDSLFNPRLPPGKNKHVTLLSCESVCAPPSETHFKLKTSSLGMDQKAVFFGVIVKQKYVFHDCSLSFGHTQPRLKIQDRSRAASPRVRHQSRSAASEYTEAPDHSEEQRQKTYSALC